MAAKKRNRVRLLDDLSAFDTSARRGALAWTVPNDDTGMAMFSRWVVIRFDDGATLDVAYACLELVPDPANEGGVETEWMGPRSEAA